MLKTGIAYFNDTVLCQRLFFSSVDGIPTGSTCLFTTAIQRKQALLVLTQPEKEPYPAFSLYVRQECV